MTHREHGPESQEPPTPVSPFTAEVFNLPGTESPISIKDFWDIPEQPEQRTGTESATPSTGDTLVRQRTLESRGAVAPLQLRSGIADALGDAFRAAGLGKSTKEAGRFELAVLFTVCQLMKADYTGLGESTDAALDGPALTSSSDGRPTSIRALLDLSAQHAEGSQSHTIVNVRDSIMNALNDEFEMIGLSHYREPEKAGIAAALIIQHLQDPAVKLNLLNAHRKQLENAPGDNVDRIEEINELINQALEDISDTR